MKKCVTLENNLIQKTQTLFMFLLTRNVLNIFKTRDRNTHFDKILKGKMQKNLS